MERIVKKLPTPSSVYRDLAIYSAGDGCLGAYVYNRDHGTEIDWEACREQFQEFYPNVTRVLYWTYKVKEVAAFIRHAEDILRLPKAKRAKLYRTNSPNVLFCLLGPFWRSKVHRQLFTILLRAGREYNIKRKNFWATALRHAYLANTHNAFRHFMKGNTDYCGKFFSGWVDAFSYITPDEVKRKLVKKHANREREKIPLAGVRRNRAGGSGSSRTNATNRAKVSRH